ncbi:MAG: helix-turn-helix domain-containing protein [Oligoflexales bacterium]
MNPCHDENVGPLSLNEKIGAGINKTLFFDNSIESKGLLNATEVAELLGVSPKTIYFWAKTKRIRSVLLGRCVRFRPVDIQAILSGHRDF